MTNIADPRAKVSPMWTLFEYGFMPTVYILFMSVIAYLISTSQSLEIASLALPLALMASVFVLERIHPLNPDWNRYLNDVRPDVGSFVLVALGLESCLKALSPLLATWMVLALNLPSARLLPAMPLWLETIGFILFVEFAKYWFHRLSHTRDSLWPLHSVHHSVKRMHLLNGFRIHPLYHFITYVLGVLPCVLIGVKAESLIIHGVVLAIAATFQHANVKLRYGFLNYIFSTNELHRWHHSIIISEGNNNFGAILSLYDVIFGTHYLRNDPGPIELGIDREHLYPMNNFRDQLILPFRWKKFMSEPADDPSKTP